MHDGVTTPTRNQPAIHGHRQQERDHQAEEKAPPEQAVSETCGDRPRHRQDERVVDYFHRRDRDGVGREREPRRSPRWDTRAGYWPERERIAEHERERDGQHDRGGASQSE